MFKFLKDKIKQTVSKFTKSVEEEVPDEKTEVIQEKQETEEITKQEEPKSPEPEKEEEPQEETEEPEPEDEDEIPAKEAEETEKPEPKEEAPSEEAQEALEKDDPLVSEPEEEKEELQEQEEEPSDEPEPEGEEKEEEQEAEKKGFFSGLKQIITTKKISEQKFDDLFWDLELALMENNTAVEVIEKIKADLKKDLVDKPIRRSDITGTIMKSLKRSIQEVISVETFDLVEKAKSKKPYVICFVGINGSGKTTTIAKVANMFKEKGMVPVLAAADTFRAAAIDQLQEHADKLGIKIIKHDYGSDAAAVAFDAVEHAKSKNKDVVLIDTAGRLHSNSNLMDEMKKVIRVAKPDCTIFVGESITGNDCVEQAQKFAQTINIDGIVLSKADIDEKGGAAISVSYVTKKPILYIGTGQEYKDLEKFSSEKVIAGIGL